MRVSKKAYYGLRAMISIASRQQAVSAHELAKTEHIPEDFLEKILQKLRGAGLIHSKKGVDGGYTLARSKETISVRDILAVLDSQLHAFSPPLTQGTLPCTIPSHCQANTVWRDIEQTIDHTLTHITLAQLTYPH